MFVPTKKQLGFLSANMADLEIVGNFQAYPQIEVKPCIEKFDSFIEPNDCYMNALRIMAELYVRGEHEGARYICGITWGYNLPICHAWIKLDGIYYDPTLEASKKAFYGERFNGYFAMAELDMETLFEVTLGNDCNPPHPAYIVSELPELLLPTKEGFTL